MAVLPWMFGEATIDAKRVGTVNADFSTAFVVSDAAIYSYDAGNKRVEIAAPGVYHAFANATWATAAAGNPPGTDRIILNLNVTFGGAGGSHEPLISRREDRAHLDFQTGLNNVWELTVSTLINVPAAAVPARVSLTAQIGNSGLADNSGGDAELGIVQWNATPVADVF